jgi:hypothetical protein
MLIDLFNSLYDFIDELLGIKPEYWSDNDQD